MTLACLDFTYHLKAHTISNKLVPIVFAQKKGGESYDSYKYLFKFRWFQVSSPPSTHNKQQAGIKSISTEERGKKL